MLGIHFWKSPDPEKTVFFPGPGTPPGGVPDPPEPGFRGVPESQSRRSKPGGSGLSRVLDTCPVGGGCGDHPTGFFVSTPPPGDLGHPRPGATVTSRPTRVPQRFHQGPSRIATPRARLRGFRVNIQITNIIFFNLFLMTLCCFFLYSGLFSFVYSFVILRLVHWMCHQDLSTTEGAS